MPEIIVEDIYNFTFEEASLQRFKDGIMIDLSPKQIDALIGHLSVYVQVCSTHEMHQRIYKNETDKDFESKMLGIKKLQSDLGRLLKKIGQK